MFHPRSLWVRSMFRFRAVLWLTQPRVFPLRDHHIQPSPIMGIQIMMMIGRIKAEIVIIVMMLLMMMLALLMMMMIFILMIFILMVLVPGASLNLYLYFCTLTMHSFYLLQYPALLHNPITPPRPRAAQPSRRPTQRSGDLFSPKPLSARAQSTRSHSISSHPGPSGSGVSQFQTHTYPSEVLEDDSHFPLTRNRRTTIKPKVLQPSSPYPR